MRDAGSYSVVSVGEECCSGFEPDCFFEISRGCDSSCVGTFKAIVSAVE